MIVRKNEAGLHWSDLATGDPLAAVLDPSDTVGAKNQLIDRVHKRALRRTLPSLRGQRVLDFGCGTGRLSAWCWSQGAVVTGVDITSEMIEVARTEVPSANFVHLTTERLPFASESFDIIITAYVLQYYASDHEVFRELARVLGRGGVCAAIEQVTDQAIGRGADLSTYERSFAAAPLQLTRVMPLRAGNSAITGLAGRHPRLIRVPLLAQAAEWETRLTLRRASGRNTYVDYLFVAKKPTDETAVSS